MRLSQKQLWCALWLRLRGSGAASFQKPSLIPLDILQALCAAALRCRRASLSSQAHADTPPVRRSHAYGVPFKAVPIHTHGTHTHVNLKPAFHCTPPYALDLPPSHGLPHRNPRRQDEAVAGAAAAERLPETATAAATAVQPNSVEHPAPRLQRSAGCEGRAVRAYGGSPVRARGSARQAPSRRVRPASGRPRSTRGERAAGD